MNRRPLIAGLLLLASAGGIAEELYRQFQPARTSRTRESTEWSITYTYNALDRSHPRLLLIGDSICNGYQGTVRNKLGKIMNITFWASSKCVTDKDYFRELDQILSAYHYDVISFNNGLHSLTTNREEWKNAYQSAVDFIRKKCPDAKLFLTNNTPLKDPVKTAQAKELNQIIAETAKLKKLPVIDLFSLMDPLDRNKFWNDTYHFRKPAVEMQAERIAGTVRALPGIAGSKADLIQRGTETGPDGALK